MFSFRHRAMLGEAAVSAASAVEIGLHGWVAKNDDLAHLTETARSHGYKRAKSTSGDDHAASPYSCYFEASFLPEKQDASEKPERSQKP